MPAPDLKWLAWIYNKDWGSNAPLLNMFDKLSEVPAPIREYYEEDVRSEPTGSMIDEPYKYIDENGDEQSGVRSVAEYHDVTYVVVKPFGEIQNNVVTVLELFRPKDIVDKFLEFENNGIDKAFHDSYLAWFNDEPIQDDYTKEEPNYDSEGTTSTMYDQDAFNEAHQTWQAKEPTRPAYKKLDDYPEYKRYRKMIGVEFEGVMCSAVKDDQFGIGSLYQAIKAGSEFNFEFTNGSTLKLTPSNIDAFMGVWGPFRNSFF